MGGTRKKFQERRFGSPAQFFYTYGSLAGLTHIWVFGVKFWVIIQKNMGVEPLFVMLLKQFSFATLPIKKQFLAKISTFLVSFGDACIM
jgi:hypothetical protein